MTEAAQGGALKETAQGEAPKETVREAAPKETVQSGAPKETAQEAVNPKEPVSRITANGDKTVIVVDETSRNDNISTRSWTGSQTSWRKRFRENWIITIWSM